jgi:hypothetical protein
VVRRLHPTISIGNITEVFAVADAELSSEELIGEKARHPILVKEVSFFPTHQ